MAESALNFKKQNETIQRSLIESIKDIFPIEKNGKILELENIELDDKLDDFDFPAQREIKLNRKSWQNPIYGSFVLKDSNGNVISKKEKIKIGYIPKLTNRQTMLIDGNEYQTTNQIRRKSGIYARIKQNGELESEFNLSKGHNFKMQLDPETQVFYISFENRRYRLWTLLNTLGVSDTEISKSWGNKLLDINKAGALNTEASELTALYKRFYKKDETDFRLILEGINKYFKTGTAVDPETTELTLGKKFNIVDGSTLLAASDKLLKISKGDAKLDDRDSLIYKHIYSADDLLHSYFESQKPVLKSKLERTLGMKSEIRDIVSPGTFSDPIKKFFTTGDLSSTPVQTNPLMIASEIMKTTVMGTGGIKSQHAVTDETRNVEPTQLGFLDPNSSPESLKIGLSVGLSSEVRKVGKEIKTPVFNDKTKEIEFFSPLEFFKKTVGFPDQRNAKPNEMVKVMEQGVVKEVMRKDVQYFLRSTKSMFSYPTNMMPFLQNTQTNRTLTGSRMMTQALPLDEKEPPLVRVRRDSKGTYEDIIGSFLNPYTEEAGEVTKIDDNYIYIKNDKGTRKYGLFKDFPLNQDGYLNSTPVVKVGDKVEAKKMLAESNYSVGPTLSMGKNLTVGYMSYKGLNFEDGVVITESAAKSLTHSTIHRENIYYNPKLTILDKDKFIAWYPEEMTSDNYNKLDKNGIIKIGETVNPHEVIAALLVERQMDDMEKALKKLDKYTFNNYSKNVSVWDEDDPGVVTDVKMNGRNIDIYIKAKHPFKEGDKLAGSWGNKGIVTKIIPDADAPRTKNGEVIQVLLSPEGVPGRMNIGQILATAAGRIAEKKGEPYIVDNFDDPQGDSAKKVLNEMKELGINPNETLIDGATGKEIERPIFVGKQYIYKLRHIVKKKQASHSFGTYDIDEQPAGKGAQKIGILDSYAYLAHGAKANLREYSEVKSRANEEYWRDLQFGMLPGKPNRNFIFEKMVAYLKGTGVNVEKTGNKIRIFPLRDEDTVNLSKGELTDPGALLIGKNLESRKGGLFDVATTGGMKGKNWSHIELAERIPNPIYEDAITKILDLSEKDYNSILTGKKELNGDTGVSAIVKSLKDLNIDAQIDSISKELKVAPPTNINKLNTRLKYLKVLKELNYKPEEAYTITKLPVIPPQFRPVYPLPSGDLMVSDLNKHYRDVGVINKNFREAKDFLTKEDNIKTANDLYLTVKALQGFSDPITYSKNKYKGTTTELGEMKTGLIQGALWTKRQDLSARSTITVNPDLDLDQIGIPKSTAYTIFKPFIVRDMKDSGIKPSDALKYYKEEDPLAWNSLGNVIKNRPIILNRAPSLHKHSVQAFKPILVDGKAIQLNPMINKGFNADYDGDTMSIHVPVSSEAVDEAYGMLPSKILFKHGDNQLIPELSKDYIFGVHALSKIEKNTGKSFKSIDEAKKAGINWNDEFKLNGKPMTIGQWELNSVLPDKYKDYTRELSSKKSGKVLEDLAKEDPDKFVDVLNHWKTLGSNYAYSKGHTVSITDFVTDKSYRDNLLKTELPKINKLQGDKKVEALNELTKKVEASQWDSVNKTNFANMLNSGSFTKKDSIRQVMSMPGVLVDVNGDPIPIPLVKSYGEGLDAASYWISMYGARKGTVDRAVNTQQSGALNKSLLSVARKLLVTIEDCNTDEGLEIELDSKDVMDRCLLETIKGVGKRNDIIGRDEVLKAKKVGLLKLPVRSPLTCEAPEGVCQKCYGLLPNGVLAPIGTNVGVLDSQAVTERSTQLVMKCSDKNNRVKIKCESMNLDLEITHEGLWNIINSPVNIEDTVESKSVPEDLKILTDEGFKKVKLLQRHKPNVEMIFLRLEDGNALITQRDHPLYLYNTDIADFIYKKDYFDNNIKDIESGNLGFLVDYSYMKNKMHTCNEDLFVSPYNFGNSYLETEHNKYNLYEFSRDTLIDILCGIIDRYGLILYNREKHVIELRFSNISLSQQVYHALRSLQFKAFLSHRNNNVNADNSAVFFNIYYKDLEKFKNSKLVNKLYKVSETNLYPLSFDKHVLKVDNWRVVKYADYTYDIPTEGGKYLINGILYSNTFHSGGSALAKGGVSDSFPRLEQLLKVPEKLSGKAVISSVDGVVESIEKNLTGGYNVKVGTKLFIVPAGRMPVVSQGQVIKSGDRISDGSIKPQELSEFKDHLSAQKYLVDEMNKIYDNQFYKKTFETVIRGITDNAIITSAPEDSGYYRGDKVSKSSLDYLNKSRVKEKLQPIEYKPFFKSIDVANTNSPDWLTRISTNRVKAALSNSAARGMYTNIKGKDPIPAYLYGEGFGLNTDPEKGEFY